MVKIQSKPVHDMIMPPLVDMKAKAPEMPVAVIKALEERIHTKENEIKNVFKELKYGGDPKQISELVEKISKAYKELQTIDQQLEKAPKTQEKSKHLLHMRIQKALEKCIESQYICSGIEALRDLTTPDLLSKYAKNLAFELHSKLIPEYDRIKIDKERKAFLEKEIKRRDRELQDLDVLEQRWVDPALKAILVKISTKQPGQKLINCTAEELTLLETTLLQLKKGYTDFLSGLVPGKGDEELTEKAELMLITLALAIKEVHRERAQLHADPLRSLKERLLNLIKSTDEKSKGAWRSEFQIKAELDLFQNVLENQFKDPIIAKTKAALLAKIELAAKRFEDSHYRLAKIQKTIEALQKICGADTMIAKRSWGGLGIVMKNPRINQKVEAILADGLGRKDKTLQWHHLQGLIEALKMGLAEGRSLNQSTIIKAAIDDLETRLSQLNKDRNLDMLQTFYGEKTLSSISALFGRSHVFSPKTWTAFRKAMDDPRANGLIESILAGHQKSGKKIVDISYVDLVKLENALAYAKEKNDKGLFDSALKEVGKIKENLFKEELKAAPKDVRRAFDTVQNFLGKKFPLEVNLKFSFLRALKTRSPLKPGEFACMPKARNFVEAVEQFFANIKEKPVQAHDEHVLEDLTALFLAPIAFPGLNSGIDGPQFLNLQRLVQYKAGFPGNLQVVKDSIELAFLSRDEAPRSLPLERHFLQVKHVHETLSSLTKSQQLLAKNGYKPVNYGGVVGEVWGKSSWKQELNDRGLVLKWEGGFALGDGSRPKMESLTLDFRAFGKMLLHEEKELFKDFCEYLHDENLTKCLSSEESRQSLLEALEKRRIDEIPEKLKRLFLNDNGKEFKSKNPRYELLLVQVSQQFRHDVENALSRSFATLGQ